MFWLRRAKFVRDLKIGSPEKAGNKLFENNSRLYRVCLLIRVRVCLFVCWFLQQIHQVLYPFSAGKWALFVSCCHNTNLNLCLETCSSLKWNAGHSRYLYLLLLVCAVPFPTPPNNSWEVLLVPGSHLPRHPADNFFRFQGHSLFSMKSNKFDVSRFAWFFAWRNYCRFIDFVLHPNQKPLTWNASSKAWHWLVADLSFNAFWYSMSGVLLKFVRPFCFSN